MRMRYRKIVGPEGAFKGMDVGDSNAGEEGDKKRDPVKEVSSSSRRGEALGKLHVVYETCSRSMRFSEKADEYRSVLK